MAKLKEKIETTMRNAMDDFTQRNHSKERLQQQIEQLEKREEKRAVSPVQDNTSDSEIIFENKNKDNGISQKTLNMMEMKKNYQE